MKTGTKALIVTVCALVLVVGSVMGTLAYLTDKDAVTNTFTVGEVHLTLDEADVKTDGTYEEDHDKRVDANEYHLIPGHTYIKDPTVTVLKDSEESYVRMLVTVSFASELDAIFAPTGANLLTIFNGYDSSNWKLHAETKDTAANTRTYEFRYVGEAYKGSKDGTVAKVTADTKLDDLFESITVPGFITNDQLATLVKTDANGNITSQFTITVNAHAIQADGFDTADQAWAAFTTQNP